MIISQKYQYIYWYIKFFRFNSIHNSYSGIYLERSIVSLQKQTLKDIEIIAVNDCSTDNSYNILKNFASKDERIKIFNRT